MWIKTFWLSTNKVSDVCYLSESLYFKRLEVWGNNKKKGLDPINRTAPPLKKGSKEKSGGASALRDFICQFASLEFERRTLFHQNNSLKKPFIDKNLPVYSLKGILNDLHFSNKGDLIEQVTSDCCYLYFILKFWWRSLPIFTIVILTLP